MTMARSFRYPWTWVAMIVSLAGAVVIFLWFRSDSLPAAAGLATGSLLLGLASWWPMLRLGRDFRQHLQDEQSASQFRDLETLGEDLDRLGSEQGRIQLNQFNDKLDAFMDVLRLRFSEDELTFGRYQQTARLVHEGGLQNLRNLRAALESIKTIDISTLESRLAQMTDDNAERTTLLRRRALHTEQMAKADRLLVENEEAITALTNVSTALANTDTESGMATGDAIEALESLAKRSARYAAN